MEEVEGLHGRRYPGWTSESPSDTEELIVAEAVSEAPPSKETSAALKAVIEAAIYITDEPLTPEQIATAVEQPIERVKRS